MFDRGVVHIVVAGYVVDHYCLRFHRGVVHIVVAVILLTITVSCLTEEWFILLTITVCGLTEKWFVLLWLAMFLTITV